MTAITNVRPARTRRLAGDDLPQVASMFGAVFRPGIPVDRPDLIAHLRAIYLDAPWYDPAISPVVHLHTDGTIDGFFGVQAMPLQLHGRPLRAGITGTLMVAHPGRDPLASVRMAAAYATGPQDLTISDTVNRTALEVARAQRYTILPAYSLDWQIVWQPGGYALDWLRRGGRPNVARAASVPARLLDRARAPLPLPAGADAGDHIGIAAFAEHAERLAARWALRPSWTDGALQWQLAIAAGRRDGGPLRCRLLRDRAGTPRGASLMQAAPHGIATVLQILAPPEAVWRTVLDALCHARALGCVGVRGRGSPALLSALFALPNVRYRHRGAAVIHSRDPAVIQAARCGDALIGGLVGDTWTRLATDSFAESRSHLR